MPCMWCYLHLGRLTELCCATNISDKTKESSNVSISGYIDICYLAHKKTEVTCFHKKIDQTRTHQLKSNNVANLNVTKLNI